MFSRVCLVPLLLGGLFCQKALAEAPQLDAIIAAPGLWQESPEEFARQTPDYGFYWLSQAKDRAESHLRSVTLFSQPVCETDVQFESGKVSQVVVSIYNRGDAGDLAYAQFYTLINQCIQHLTALTHTQPPAQVQENADAVKAYSIPWQNAASRYVLEYSFTREVKTRHIPFRAEFVRLRVTPVEKPKSFMAAALAADTPAQRFDGPSHVKKLPSGDVFLQTVPMVDQGEKGYCVVATAERVMRYYGVQTDEHELAELANSSATTGTSLEAMLGSLKKVASRLRVRISTVQAMDVHQFLAMIADYNRAARRKRLPEIPTTGPVLDMAAIYSGMSAKVFREVRTRNKAEIDRMLQQVQDRVDQGIPLLWTVMLGMVPEQKAPQVIGGHMRLIIGYNLATSEILYSDSWGPGHELKRMPAADAWTITTGLNTIEPL